MLADDHQDLLLEITNLLSAEFDVVGAVADGMALLKESARLKPDVVVTDIRMPGINGIQAGHDLLRAHDCKAVLLLSLYGDPVLAETAFNAGIRGYVLKVNAGEELIPAIHRLAAGGTYFTRKLNSGLND